MENETIIEQIREKVEELMPRLRKVGDKDATMTTEEVRAKFDSLLSFIDAVQEQPAPKKTSIVDDLRHHLATTPKEQLEKEWEDLKEWGKVGPTVAEFLGWNQPVCEGLDNIAIMNEIRTLGCYPSEFDVARHFYELGKQSECVKVKAESSIDRFILENCTHCTIEHCLGMRECYTSSNKQLQ